MENTSQDFIQPNNLEAEEAVIGSILIDPDAYFEVASTIRPDDFYLVDAKIDCFQNRVGGVFINYTKSTSATIEVSIVLESRDLYQFIKVIR